MMKFPINGKIKTVPNHQPDYEYSKHAHADSKSRRLSCASWVSLHPLRRLRPLPGARCPANFRSSKATRPEVSDSKWWMINIWLAYQRVYQNTMFFISPSEWYPVIDHIYIYTYNVGISMRPINHGIASDWITNIWVNYDISLMIHID